MTTFSRFFKVFVVTAISSASAYSVSAYDPDLLPVQIIWGIRPYVYIKYNGTRFMTADETEWGVSAFNERYVMRLAFMGEGTFNETDGFERLVWVGDPVSAANAAALWPNSPFTGSFGVSGNQELPLDWLGSLDDLDPDGEIYADYESLWQTLHFGVLVYDTISKRAFRISSAPNGLDFKAESAFDSPIKAVQGEGPPSPDGSDNLLNLIPNTESKAVYLGAEIPQRCVWMADKGLAAADLAGYDEKAVALAMALDKVPAEVAGGVELAVDSFALDPQAGTATLVWHFTATDGNGESAAVSSLRGGARLLLETASSAGDLGTENASKQEVSLSSSSVTIPTSGETFFARLVLDTP